MKVVLVRGLLHHFALALLLVDLRVAACKVGRTQTAVSSISISLSVRWQNSAFAAVFGALPLTRCSCAAKHLRCSDRQVALLIVTNRFVRGVVLGHLQCHQDAECTAAGSALGR